MINIHLLNAILCAACCLRLILFARSGATHRPWASALAYLLIVAFGAIAVLTLFGRTQDIGVPQLVINMVVLTALLSVGGNVVELFRPTSDNRQSFILRLLRREKWI